MNSDGLGGRWFRNVTLAAIGLLLIGLAAYLAQPKTAALSGPAAEIKHAIEVEREVVATYDAAKEVFSQGKIDADKFVEIIKTEVLAPWREAESRLRKIDTHGMPEKGRDRIELLLKSMKLREQSWGLIIDSLREGSDEGMASAGEKAAEADRLEAEIVAEAAGKKQ